MKTSRRIATVTTLVGAAILLSAGDGSADSFGTTGIVASIHKAPVTADGDVTGQPFDYVIELDGSLDPQVLGRTIPAGGTIKVFFPKEFDLGNLDPAYPLADVPSPAIPCVPGSLLCTTSFVLRGWPQDPLFPPSAFFTLAIDAVENFIALTAVKDIGLVPGVDRAPYIKQIHLLLGGVRNPAPGKYRLRVEAQTGPAGSVESGEGLVRVLARPRPSINVTGVFVEPLLSGACGPAHLPPNPNNPVYQTADAGEDAPFPWTFLLWGADREPLDDVRLRRATGNLYWLVRGNGHHFRHRDAIGYVRIQTPPGARGHELRLNNDDLAVDCPTLLPAAPVIGATPGLGPQPVGRLDLRFKAGDKAGVYRTTLALIGGNRVQMVVIVP